jgi:glycosyltransferase involved in cell wall biosynthesis
VLGEAVGNNRARTGIFRVVENLALQLAVRKDIVLQFTAVKNLSESLGYIERHPVFSRIPLSCNALPLFVDTAKKKISGRIKASSFPAKQTMSIARMLLSGSQKILTGYNGEGNVKRFAGDIFHSPFLPLPSGIRSKFSFITVYDLIPILRPQYFQFQENHLLSRVVKCIDESTWVFCISEATKNDLLNYNPGVDPRKVAVIPLGASDLFHPCSDEQILQSVREKYRIPEQPYFLSLSTLEPRKNIDSTIRAFVALVRQERLQNINLVLVGAKGWDFDKIFDEISGCVDLRERIIVTGYVDDDDLAAIYSGATAFIYPSFYEGFGLPPLEAMQCGIPVITSNTSSLPEVVGDAGIQVDPADNEALSQAMLELLKNDPLRRQLSERSRERARLFSWEACADVTINHYRQAMNTAA